MEKIAMNCEEEGHKLRIVTGFLSRTDECHACTRTFPWSREASSYYSCPDCHIIIHKKCAESPKQIDHPMHPEHPLLLLSKPPYESKTSECQVCKESWQNFSYHCSICKFDIDILCAFLDEGTLHLSTHHHPVRLIRRPASFKCNACGVKEGDDCESYMCSKPACGFWIHKECGLLPEKFPHPDHDHILEIATRVPVRYQKYNFTCEVCHEDLGTNLWVYYCQMCKFFIHSNCRRAIRPSLALNTITTFYVRDLEMISALKTISEHILPDDFVKQMHLTILEPRVEEIKVYISHKHSLVLKSYFGRESRDEEAICDGCTETCNNSRKGYLAYYKCVRNCSFFLHATCAFAPRIYYVPEDEVHNHDNNLLLHFPLKPWEFMKCNSCNSLCNGYGYKCLQNGCNFFMDIKCLYLRGDMRHIGHMHNLKSRFSWHFSEPFTCIGCGCKTKTPRCFSCADCAGAFGLGYECATLPASVSHRWDKHPLILTFPPFFRDSIDADEEFYCEVCEEEIHPKRWIYRCAECDQSFHPNCIPTLGKSKNIKFGNTSSIRSHPHQLTLVSQVKLTSRCHSCQKALNWSMAFECALCGFCLCSDCISKEELVVEHEVNSWLDSEHSFKHNPELYVMWS